MTESLNSKSAFLARIKKRVKAVEIDGLGTVYIRSLGGGARARMADQFKQIDQSSAEEAQKAIQCKLVSLVLVNEEGDRIFGDDDIAEIAALDAKVLDDIAAAGMEASGLGKQALEQAEKNSVTLQSGSSPSDSPASLE